MEGSVNFVLMGLVSQKIQCHLASLNPSWTKKKKKMHTTQSAFQYCSV